MGQDHVVCMYRAEIGFLRWDPGATADRLPRPIARERRSWL